MRKLIKYFQLFLIFVIAISFSSCVSNALNGSNGSNITPIVTAAPQIYATSGWEFTILDETINKSLENISTTYGYDGKTDSEKIKKVPVEGKCFLLIKTLLEKKSGTESIDWENVRVKDSNGKTYDRIEDSFLEELGFKRIQGTSLSFGSHEGWIAFEINDDAKGLTFEYNSKVNPISIALK